MTQKELIKLSASMIGGYLGCPACFWRDYHYPQKFHLPGVLNRMDKLEKDYYDRHRGQTPPILRSQIKEKLVDIETAQKLRKGSSAGKTNQHGKLYAENRAGYR